MRCPYCRRGDTKVIDSRGTQEESIRRRRECLDCSRRFTTYERIEEAPLKVLKRDGRVVPFDRGTLRAGLEKAVYKRPVAPAQVEEVIDRVEKSVYDDFERTIPSVEIGDLVMQSLQDLDQVAYIRFASVYSNFSDASDFTEMAGTIASGASGKPGQIRRTDRGESSASSEPTQPAGQSSSQPPAGRSQPV